MIIYSTILIFFYEIGDKMQIDTASSLKENRRHGDTSFPSAVYRIERKACEQVLDCHWHEECEFFIVLEGAALFQLGTQYFQVQAGEAVYIHSGEIHAAHPIEGQGCTYAALVFDANFFNSSSFDSVQSQYILPWIKKEKTPPFHLTGDQGWSKRIIDTLISWITLIQTKPRGYQMLFKAQFYLMLYEIEAAQQWIKPKALNTIDDHKLERVKTVLRYIDQNYHQKILIKELALLVNMSEGHFCRFFKSYVHKTPVEYINNLRVRKAEKLLLQENKKILDIAFEVGFDHFSYFIKVFRDTLKCTPSKYRRNAFLIKQKEDV
jgi:AraC-like DNA-binding protein/mannose-6-phosphate isomerase-like protein (cupin superfamily)